MNNNQLDDLKQFITSVASQTEARLEDKIEDLRTTLETKIDGLRTNLETKIDDLRTEMNDGFAGIAEAIKQIPLPKA